MRKTTRLFAMLVFVIQIFNTQKGLTAQTHYSPEKLTTEDYEKGEMSLWQHTFPLIFNSNVYPNWIDGANFWYRNNIPEGKEFILVDIEKRTLPPKIQAKTKI